MSDVLLPQTVSWSIQPQSYEIVVHNYLGWEVPCHTLVDHEKLDRLHGWRHRDIYDFLQEDAERRDRWIAMKLYGSCAIENVRWPATPKRPTWQPSRTRTSVPPSRRR